MRNTIIATSLWLLISPALHGAEEESSTPSPELTIKRIFDSGDFSSKGYSAEWLQDGTGYLRTIDSAETKGGKDIVMIEPESGATNIWVAAQDLIPEGESSPLSINDYSFSKDRSKLLIYTNSKKVWRRHSRGDYWVLDRTSLELKQLGGEVESSNLMHAKLSPDGNRAGYVHRNHLYVEELRTGEIIQLTESDSPHIINGTFDWVNEEEFSLYDGWRWSPDSGSIAFWQCDTRGVKEYPLVNYTGGLYPEIQWIHYPKTGELNSAVRIGVVDVVSRSTQWLNIPGDPRNHYLHYLEWPDHGEGIVIQQLNRLQNTNRLMVADPETGEVRQVIQESDPAWVDVRTWNPWAGSEKVFPWLSEKDGWRHLYSVDLESGRLKKLFNEPFDVIALEMFDEETGRLYFMASPDNATQQYLYTVNLDGRGLKRLTPEGQTGTHSYSISPNGKWAIHTWSSFDQPPRTQFIKLPDHTMVRELENNEALQKQFDAVAKSPVAFVSFPIDEQWNADAWLIHPPEFDPEKKYPLIVYVYGEPAGQTVTDRWQGRGMLWHRFLAQQGFVVASIDNRGTPAPKGRAWRKSIYRQVGILAPDDQANALKHLLSERPYLDADRVGIWGWSGGGSMTLNAIFKHPDLYQAGIAVAAVPNMRLYDTIYQERYMGLPDDNVDGYRDGSPLHFAHQLEGDLFLVHGTADDNVHYQGFEMLVDRLVHHGKQFEMLAYPNRTHGIGEGQNTTLHLRQAMWDFWQESLLGGRE